MKDLAEKSKLAFGMEIVGFLFSVFADIYFIYFITKTEDDNELVLAFVIFSILAISNLFGIIWDLKRPNIIIKKDNDVLQVYCKGNWNTVKISDIVDVKFSNSTSGRTVLSSGVLSIYTTKDIFRLYNVKNVKDVWMNINTVLDRSENSELI